MPTRGPFPTAQIPIPTAYDTSGTGYSVTFTYPDGETYTWKEDRNFSSGATSPDFDSGKYPDGMTLDRVQTRVGAFAVCEK